MKQFYSILILLLSSILCWAQKNGSVKGTVMDTLAKQPVAAATLTILNRKDSSLVSFSMTNDKGQFELKGLGNGDYRLMITHINYHNSNKYFSITDGKKQFDLGNVIIHDAAKVLAEVVVAAEAPPVTLVGDTIQYNAGSFKVQPNATVEDLLKKLPGVKVDKDGTVKAQGQKVNKVLVDGKEFFGDDPKIATRNLPADAVDKVQVFDKQSEQSQLTGFDDGNSEKTINLKLKKDKKKGLFGKAMAGYGTNDRYEGRFNINSFKGARQFSVIGMANNDNAEGFSFFDMLNFSGELSRLKQGGNGGNINITINSNDASSFGGNNNGINTTRAGGFNYNNILGKKTDFQSNYFYSRTNPNTEKNIQRQYFLPDSSYFSNQNSFSSTITNSHRLNLNADIIIDSFHSLRITPSFGYQETQASSYADYENLSNLQQRSIDGFSRNSSNNKGMNFRNDLLFRKKFRRKGRTFSVSLQNSFNNTDGDGSLESVNKFYNHLNAALLRTDSINQQFNTKGNLEGYSTRLAYTEPIFKKSLIEFSIGNSNTHSKATKETFDYNKQNGKYDQLNQLLTNDFENRYGYTRTGLRIRTQKKKYNYSVGASWQQATLEGKIITGTKDSVIRKTFNNVLPNARLQYNFTRYRNLVLNYSANTNQPNASQLQPVPDNSDPLNIRFGNPDLKQEYSNAIQIQFTSINPFKNRNLFLFLNLIKTDNKIVNNDVFVQGIKTSQPVNVNGVFNMNGDLSISFPIRLLKGSITMSTNSTYFRNKQLVNGAENTSNTVSIGPDVRLDMQLGEKVNWSLNSGFNYNNTSYSLASARDARYISQQYSTSFDWQLPKNFFVATDFNYTINNQLAEGFNANIAFFNASISKQILRFNRGELKLKAYDLLNQNLGINRTSNQNYIEDIRQRNLRRFFLLSFTYSLNKNGLGQGGGGGMKMIVR
ncbi:MAG: outer membrane beta-barrel family protein [Chitinophagaceae bacterium]